MNFINDYILNLKDKYADKLFSCKKDTSQIVDYLHSRFTLLNIDLSNPSYARNMHSFKLNCINSINNEKLQLSYDDLDILSFLINKDFKSSNYYSIRNELNLDIFVALEVKTGDIQSNCSELCDELYIYRGVSEYDIKNDTPDLISYLITLDKEFSK